METIRQKVEQALVAIGLNPAAVHSQSRLDKDLGLNSIGIAELVMALENTFHLESPDLEVRRLKTVGERPSPGLSPP
jgi:acyl carrier protein